MKQLRFGEAQQVGVSAERIRNVINLCSSWVADGSTPALITLVARRGVIFLHEAWGQIGPEPDSPAVSLDTILGTASISKSVTATAAMILVERGQVGINHPVQKYVPEFKGDGFERVTLRHLLTHTSGLPYRSGLAFDALGDAGFRLTPGQEMRYSNVGYDLLGEIIERVSGQSFHAFTHEHIFAPLGMNAATFVLPGKTSPGYIQPRPGTNFDWPDEAVGTTSASSTLCATAMDMAIFGQTFLNHGSYGNCHLLSPATVAAMTRSQIADIPRETLDGVAAPPCGYGWFMLEQCQFEQWPSLLSPQGYGHSVGHAT